MKEAYEQVLEENHTVIFIIVDLLMFLRPVWLFTRNKLITESVQ